MVEKKKPKFLRRTSNRYSKLGKGRKKKQKWVRPTGRDNKMRERRRGYPARVTVGYASDKKTSGLLKGKNPVLIKNIKDLEKIKENEIAIIGKIGKKKKMEIVKFAKEKKMKLHNVNVESFLKKAESKGKKETKKEDSKTKPKENASKEKKK
jgi:large subunit ribosomal protein L32e